MIGGIGLLVPFGDSRLFQIAWLFLKTGLLSFGGAYASLVFVQRGAVVQYHWLSDGQLLDGVALSVATPGPFMLFTTFVGYLASGIPGAVVGNILRFRAVIHFCNCWRALRRKTQGKSSDSGLSRRCQCRSRGRHRSRIARFDSRGACRLANPRYRCDFLSSDRFSQAGCRFSSCRSNAWWNNLLEHSRVQLKLCSALATPAAIA